MNRGIPGCDSLFRGVHHPLAFRGSKKNLFDFGKSSHLQRNADRIETSLIWERYAPTLKEVHNYGCRLAARRNTTGKSTVYCGAYQLKAGDVWALGNNSSVPELGGVDIIHRIEDNEIAHCNLEVRLVPGIDDDIAEEVKTIIVDSLWRASRGPERFICNVDRSLNAHPNQQLPTPIGGGYVDCRSWLRWFLFLARFYLMRFLWHQGWLVLGASK